MTETPSSTPNPNPPKRSKRNTYAKIPLKTKLIFFQKVIKEKGNIRQVARKMGIKYSTAKTLARNYRGIYDHEDKQLVKTLCLEFNSNRAAKRRCGYASLDEKHLDLTPQGSSQCSMRQTRTVAINKIVIISNSFVTKKQ